MKPRLPFTKVDAALWVMLVLWSANHFTALFKLERDLNWLTDTGVVFEMRRMGMLKP